MCGTSYGVLLYASCKTSLLNVGLSPNAEASFTVEPLVWAEFPSNAASTSKFLDRKAHVTEDGLCGAQIQLHVPNTVWSTLRPVTHGIKSG